MCHFSPSSDCLVSQRAGSWIRPRMNATSSAGGPPPHKHVPPAVSAADEVVCSGGQEKSEVIARVHQCRTHRAALFGPVLGYQRSADGPFSADAYAGQKPEERQRPNSRGERGQQSEERKTKNAEHHRSYAAEPVGDGSPDQSDSPPNHEKSEEESAVVAHIGGRRGNSGSRQQIAQGWDQYQRINERVHPVHGPTGPSGPKAALLVAGEPWFESRRLHEDAFRCRLCNSVQRLRAVVLEEGED